MLLRNVRFKTRIVDMERECCKSCILNSFKVVINRVAIIHHVAVDQDFVFGKMEC